MALAVIAQISLAQNLKSTMHRRTTKGKGGRLFLCNEKTAAHNQGLLEPPAAKRQRPNVDSAINWKRGWRR
jgi:hypothetical protein